MPKLSEQEKAVLRKKLFHGGEFPAWTNGNVAKVAFSQKERLILDSAIEKSAKNKKLREKRKVKKD